MTPDELPRIPGYAGVSWLGSGGAADVYRAQREHLGRWVAVKVFRVPLHDRDAARQFRTECDAVIRLDREPDVVVVHDAGILPDGRPYLVSELCDGSLHDLVARRGALPPDEVATIGQRIATALAAAHFARVLHGDVTPQNILVRPSGAPVLADFGLAVLRDHGGGSSAGFTPGHAAPETVRQESALTERSDVYGLGSTLYTALTGHAPFLPRPGEPEMAHLQRILHEPPVRPEGAPDDLADLLMAMLAKDPAERPEAAQVAQALARGPDTTGPRYAAPAGMPAASQARTQARAALAEVPTDGATAPVARARRRPPWGLVAVLVAAVALVSALVVRPEWLGWPGSAEGAGVPGTPARIDLAPPEDRGDSVTLRWSTDRPLDFGVVVAEDGAPATVQVGDRTTSATVAVREGVQYCFQIQGADGRNPVVVSDVEGIRGALCRDGTF